MTTLLKHKPSPGVDGYRLLDDQTILDQLPDVLPGVGISDLTDLIRIQPDLGYNSVDVDIKLIGGYRGNQCSGSI